MNVTIDEDFEDAFDVADYEPSVVISPPIGEVRKSARLKRPVIRDDLHHRIAISQEMKGGHEGVAGVDQNQRDLSLVDLPAGRKPIKTMWVYKTKRADDISKMSQPKHLIRASFLLGPELPNLFVVPPRGGPP